ncbi:MAG: spore cortex biosynthesis protein YabQ [Eubacteriales bacterium]|nr:spore cortex biosynthesis protein YabQ [Eubacteriales bacterium]
MFFPMQAQLLLVLQSFLLGVGLALFYDVLRALRWYFGYGRAKTAVCDGIFWLVLLAALFEFNIAFAAAQSRYFILAGAGGGAAVYFALVSGLVLAALRLLLDGAAFLCASAAAAVSWLSRAAHRLGLPEKIRLFAKKFGKPSSIFRGKGLK